MNPATKDAKKFTPQQIDDWKRYEQVRRDGRHNMFFPGARMETGLTKERYLFAMRNYSELKAAAEAKGKA